MEPHLAEGGFDLQGLLRFVLLGEIQDEGAQTTTRWLRTTSGSVGVFPGVFDRGTSLADAAHAVDSSRTSRNGEIRMMNGSPFP